MRLNLLITTLVIFMLGNAHATTENYSFAVKGGVSLGSYEAGLNWLYLEHIKNTQAHINTITGASAGSVNTLLSALHFCDLNKSEIDKNLFRYVWDIGIEELSNGNSNTREFIDFMDELEANINSSDIGNIKGKDHGGLLNRSGLLHSLKLIDNYIETGSFINHCEVKMGIAVTKLIPDNDKLYGINIKNQRYIIPIILKIENNKVSFFNSSLFESFEPSEPFKTKSSNSDNTRLLNEIDRFIFLPNSLNGKVSKYNVYRAIMASSSFPIAFPPVSLAYCILSDNKKNNTGTQCPNNYLYQKSLFIDGGSLDNAPIGAAQRLTRQLPCSTKHYDCTLQESESFNLIYINPGRIRERSTVESESNKSYQNHEVIGILDYLSLGGHILDYGMSSELYKSLVEQHQYKNGRLITSSRFYPVVGDYLQHFGAFFDSAYRQFDYYVGIYDGIYNVVQHECRNDSNMVGCQAKTMASIVKNLKINHSDGYSIIILLGSRERYQYRNVKEWQWLFKEYESIKSSLTKKRLETSDTGKLIDIFLALDKRNCIELKACDKNVVQADFQFFLKSLVATYRYDENTQKMITSNENWKDENLQKILSRTIHVEKMKLASLRKFEKNENTTLATSNANQQQSVVSLLNVVSFYGQSYFIKNAKGYWPHSSVNECWLCFNRNSYFIPDEIGMHADNLGGYISYRFENLNITRATSFEFAIDPIHIALRTDDYASIQGLIRHDFENPFITSLGFGVKAYQTYGKKDRFPDSRYYGLIARMGFLADKIKLSAGWRYFSEKTDKRQRFELTIGLSDTKGFLALLPK